MRSKFYQALDARAQAHASRLWRKSHISRLVTPKPFVPPEKYNREEVSRLLKMTKGRLIAKEAAFNPSKLREVLEKNPSIWNNPKNPQFLTLLGHRARRKSGRAFGRYMESINEKPQRMYINRSNRINDGFHRYIKTIFDIKKSL